MNRLWVRLSIAFTLVTITGMFLLGSAGLYISRDEHLGERLLELYQLPGGFIDQLSDYFQQRGDWEGVQDILSQQDARLPRAPTGGIALSFADANGLVIYDAFYGTVSDLLSPEQRAAALAVQLDGRTIGYVQLNRTQTAPPLSPNTNPFFQQQIGGLLLMLAIFLGMFSTFAGIIVSRLLTAPLGKLAKTVRAFGTQGLGVRAEMKGSAEMVEVAAAFNEMAEALQIAENQRRNLVADIAHELRTPLSVLKSNLQAIVEGIYDFNQDEASRLLQQTELLNRLVNDLHDLSQAEARQLRLDLDLLDLPTFIQKRVQNFRPVADAHHLRLEIDVAPEPAIIQADAIRLEQVLNNLLNNAITHTPAGGKIRVSTAQHDHQAVLTIQDTGNGIPAEHLARVFERFYRVDRSRSRLTGGTGLGLAIAKAIIELHNGDMTVTSSGIPGEGAAFTITMPLTEVQSSTNQPVLAEAPFTTTV
jgi:signal transduction histidine kinase